MVRYYSAKQHDRGFTLVEVLVAVVILSLVTISFVSFSYYMLNSVKSDSQRVNALAMVKQVAGLIQSGELYYDSSKTSWECQSSPTSMSACLPASYTLTSPSSPTIPIAQTTLTLGVGVYSLSLAYIGFWNGTAIPEYTETVSWTSPTLGALQPVKVYGDVMNFN